MKTLLHICCAPCTVYPLSVLRGAGHRVAGFFHNPNIHPYKEFQRRCASLEKYAQREHLELVSIGKYDARGFLRKVVFRETERCEICYALRLTQCAEFARENSYEAFTTTLLYSRYQTHGRIRSICQSLANRFDLQFIYSDYR